jgi:hypothetical protein
MPMSTRSAALVRALVYPVQFEQNPLDGVDRVVQTVIEARCLDATPAEYRAGIEEALSSSDALARLIPQDHSEAVIRDYLAEVRTRIQNSSSRDFVPPA